nr:hypothetical protein [Tanacetum cinerariifolium]
VDEDPRKEKECNDQENENNVNNTNNVNTASSTVNADGTNEDNELLFDLTMPSLEDISIFNFLNDDKDDGIVADMNNLDTTIQVNHIPTTRIHKVHPLDQVIRDLQLATQTRKMLKNLEEHRFTEVKTTSTPMETQKPLLKDKGGEEVDVDMYRYQVNLKVSHLYAVKRIFCARNKQWLQIPQQKLNMWLLHVAMDKCFGFRINYLIMGKAKKSVRLMMEKLFGMELELMLLGITYYGWF